MDVDAAKRATDALYEKNELGRIICPTYGAVTGEGRYLLTEAIAAYLAAREGRPSISSIRPRLAHVMNYLDAQDLLETTCADVTAEWVDDFREWAIDVPVFAGRDKNGTTRSAIARRARSRPAFASSPRSSITRRLIATRRIRPRLKLIRRSMATLDRQRLGERDWIEGQIMLGHIEASKVSNNYAPFEPGYLGSVPAVTEQIIEIEALTPGAFTILDSSSIHQSSTSDEELELSH